MSTLAEFQTTLAGAAPASQAEMEAGTEAAVRAMSPLLVAQAITRQSVKPWQSVTTITKTTVMDTPAIISFVANGSLGDEGDTYTFDDGATTLIYEVDGNNDGVTGANIPLVIATGSQVEYFSAIADQIATDSAGAFTGSWDGDTDVFTVSTVATGDTVTLTLVGAGGADAEAVDLTDTGTTGGITGTPQAVVKAGEAGKFHVLSGIMVINTGAVPWTRPVTLSWQMPEVAVTLLLTCPAPDANSVTTLAGMEFASFDLQCPDAEHELIAITDTAGDTLPEEAGSDLKIIAFGFTENE